MYINLYTNQSVNMDDKLENINLQGAIDLVSLQCICLLVIQTENVIKIAWTRAKREISKTNRCFQLLNCKIRERSSLYTYRVDLRIKKREINPPTILILPSRGRC